MAKTVDRRSSEGGIQGEHRLGVSRPDLPVTDLPSPEEVFEVDKLGTKEIFRFALGPSLIALGIAVGSGEWLLGPQAVGEQGSFRGLGFVILISALLQVAYNIEIGRYVVATGEVPIVGFGRTPPGYFFWVPLPFSASTSPTFLGAGQQRPGKGSSP